MVQIHPQLDCIKTMFKLKQLDPIDDECIWEIINRTNKRIRRTEILDNI